MPTQAYDLLTIQREPNQSGPVWEGFLAGQGVDVGVKYPALARIGSALTALTPAGHKVHLLGLEMTADEATGQLTARARGPLAHLVRKPLERVVGRLNRMGTPFAVRSGGFVYNLYQPPVPSDRMVNHLARELVRGAGPLRPSTCTLQVTARCQLDCYHCSASRFKSRDREELTLDQWRDVIAQALDLGVFNIVFTGGEPLLHRDIYEMIAAVDPQRAQAMMFSNGLLLSEENVRRLVAAGLYSVNVSLDDPRPEVHNGLRRAPEGFQKATAGIARALEGGLLVGISTYASPEALHEGRIEQTIELGHELGVQEVTVFDVVPTGKLLPLQEKSLLSAEDKRRLEAMELEYNARPDYPHIITQALVNGPHGAGCFAGFSQFYMTAYGDVDPCDFTPLTFGNIRDESLEAIWDRMLTHEAYQHRCDHCRMQDPTFRHKYIDDIPPDALLPWPACEELRDRPHGPQAVGNASTSAHAAAPHSSEDMAPTYEAREDQVPQVD